MLSVGDRVMNKTDTMSHFVEFKVQWVHSHQFHSHGLCAGMWVAHTAEIAPGAPEPFTEAGGYLS